MRLRSIFILLAVILQLSACGGSGGGETAGDTNRGMLAIPHIVNGSPKGENFPEVNQIFVSFPQGLSVTCSGTWIGTRKLLTAAHCVTDGDGNVVRQNAVTVLTTLGGESSIQASTAVDVHPLYMPGNIFPSTAYPKLLANAYDFAVITFKQPFAGTPAVVTNRPPETNLLLSLVGYGTTGGNSHDTGEGLLGFTTLEKLDEYRMFWTFDGDGESNTCFGDSGGPAYADWGYGARLIGVTSGGTSPTCAKGDISFDTRVDTAIDWLQVVTGGDLAFDDFTAEPQVATTESSIQPASPKIVAPPPRRKHP